MKVLVFSLAYLPFIGGAELAVKEITDRIGDVSFDMVTANLDGKQSLEEKIGNITVYRIGKGATGKYAFPKTALAKARELHAKNHYDAIWAIMANQAGLAALAFKKEFPDVKYLLTLQEGDSLARIWSRTWFMRATYKDIYRRADGIQAISTFLANRAKKYGYTGSLVVIPNGVDLSHFKKEIADEEAEKLRKELGLTKQDRVVVTTSRLVHKNGVDVLVRAIKDMPAKALIIGNGKLMIRLKSLAQEIGVRHQVLFVGHIGHDNLPKYLKIADVFVRPSRSEGLGSAFLEAMAAGVPVIGTAVGGITDFLRDGENGLVCEVNNPRDLTTKIQRLLSDEPLRQKLIEQGRLFVDERYDWQGIAKQMRVLL